MDDQVKAKALRECDFIIMHIDELQQKDPEFNELKQTLTAIRQQFEQGKIDWTETKTSMLKAMKEAEKSDELIFIHSFLQELDIETMTKYQAFLSNIGAYIVSSPIAQAIVDIIDGIYPKQNPSEITEDEEDEELGFEFATGKIDEPAKEPVKVTQKNDYIITIHTMMTAVEKEMWSLYYQGELKASHELSKLFRSLNLLSVSLFSMEDFDEKTFLEKLANHLQNTIENPAVTNAHGFHLCETLQNIVDFIKACIKGDKVVYYTYQEKREAENEHGSKAHQTMKSLLQEIKGTDEEDNQDKPGPSSPSGDNR